MVVVVAVVEEKSVGSRIGGAGSARLWDRFLIKFVEVCVREEIVCRPVGGEGEEEEKEKKKQ